ncbi:unnamed protein product [Auanema sp. JU1783]|nr:unnamed protein product [Auanema sp. JU1783]
MTVSTSENVRKRATTESTTEDKTEKGGRSEKMGLFGAISYIVGNIVGSGIFITPGSILNQVHSVGLSMIVWVLAAFISMLGSFCYVELGTSIRVSGGDFAYLCFMKWYPVAFAFMSIGCTINYPATLAIQAQTFSEYIFTAFDVVMDSTSEYWAKKLLGFSLIWLLLFMNFFSLKTFVSKFQIVVIFAKIAATGLVIGIGFYYLIFKGDTENIKQPFHGTTFTIGTFVNALFAGLFSYDGWDILNFGAEEIDRPKRTMPLAIVIGMVCIAIIYAAVNFSYFVVLPVSVIEDSPAVAMALAKQTLGKASFIMPIFVALLLIGSLNSTMFSASRYLQAVAKQGHLPSAISGLNPICDSPRVALFIHVLISMAISFTGNLDNLINYVSFAQWSQRAITMIIVMYIKIRHVPVHPDGIRMPFVMPLLFCFVCSSLVIITIIESFNEAAVGLGILLGGLIVYLIFVWERTLSSVKAYQKIMGDINESTTKFAQIVFDVMPERCSEEDASRAIGQTPQVLSSKTVDTTSNYDIERASSHSEESTRL